MIRSMCYIDPANPGIGTTTKAGAEGPDCTCLRSLCVLRFSQALERPVGRALQAAASTCISFRVHVYILAVSIRNGGPLRRVLLHCIKSQEASIQVITPWYDWQSNLPRRCLSNQLILVISKPPMVSLSRWHSSHITGN